MEVRFKATNYEPLPTGEYPATLQNVEVSEGQYGSQVRLTFALDGQYAGRKLTAYARLSESLSGKLAKWTQSILARPIREGETVDLNALIGKPCTLVVIRATKPDGAGFNRVENVLPAPPPEALFTEP